MYGKKALSWLQQHWKPLVLWGGGVVTLLLLFMVLVLPGIVRSQAEKGIATALNRKASIAKVRINPFGMTVTVEGFRLFEPDASTPFVELGSLTASLSSSSLYRFGIVADRLSIDKPNVRLVRSADNRYNFSDILDHLARQPKKESSGGPPRFSINNISISDGTFLFDDRAVAVAGGKQHTVRELQLAIPFISNIPHLANKYTDPLFSAVINGAPLRFEGKAKPLAKSMETTLNLKLDRLNLPHYLAYLPADLPVKLAKGSLTLDLALCYRVHASQQPELTISGLTRLDDLQLVEKNGTPLASFNRFDLQAKTIEVFRRLVDLDLVRLEGLQLQASRDEKGKLNFQRLAGPPKTAKQPATKKADSGPPLRLKIARAELKNGSLSFNDRQPKGGFKARLSEINATLANISTEKDAQSSYEVGLKGDNGEQFSAKGTAVITPLAATTTFDLSNIKLQRGWPYLQAWLTRPISGNLGLTGAAEFTAADGLNAHDIALSLQKLAAPFGATDGIKLARLDLTGIGYNQRQNRAEVGEIKLAGGTVALSRERDGSLSPQALLVAKQPDETNSSSAPEPPQKPKKDDQQALAWLVKQINVSGLNVGFKDNSLTEPASLNLRNIRLATGNLQGPVFKPMPLSFNASYGKNAPIRAQGSLTPQPFAYQGSLSFSRLPISDIDPYLPDNLHVTLMGGTLDSRLRLNLRQDKAGTLRGSFSGNTGLRSFHAVDEAQQEDLLKWESLQLDQIRGTLAPFGLSIRQIALNDVYSRIAVRKDRTLNLQNLVSTEQDKGQGSQATGQEDRPKPAKPATTKAATATPAGAPQIRIDEVTIQDGTIAFSDAHLPQQFKTTFHKLGGRVTGLSSAMNQFADVDLRGSLENHSPLLIRGQINPLRDDLFVDLTISFKDIELSPASPYAGTYLGYLIDKGKLFLDLKYHIENKELKASNKVFVDQFTFGKQVPSDKATSLPIKLGVALLKDRNGEIHLDLPVTGRTDDPQFSVWGVVWQVVKNLFIKAATSPFALLSSMAGSGEDLSSVPFAYGSTKLTPAEQQKLLTLAKALNERPELKVELKGYVDKERDAEGYRSELLARKMRQEKYLELVKSGKGGNVQSADKLTIEPGEQSRYLKLVYQKEKFPKPRNFIGMLKDLPDAEMTKLIIANTKVGDAELKQLAADRVATVRAFLTDSGKMAQERLFLKGDNIYKPSAKEKGIGSRVELNPILP